MFMVFRKEKIVSYLISLSTVAFLFIMSFAMTSGNNETVTTSANVINDNEVENSTNIVNESNNIKWNKWKYYKKITKNKNILTFYVDKTKIL